MSGIGSPHFSETLDLKNFPVWISQKSFFSLTYTLLFFLMAKWKINEPQNSQWWDSQSNCMVSVKTEV